MPWAGPRQRADASRALAEPPDVATAAVLRISTYGSTILVPAGSTSASAFTHEGEIEPFILKSGEPDGYDLVLIRRQGAAA